jgi:hypothetical protein
MELSKENQLYDKQWDIVDTFYNTQEPEGFGDIVTPDETAALKMYYFINPQDNDVYKHRKQLSETNPDLVKKAEAAARKIAIADGLNDDEITDLFS